MPSDIAAAQETINRANPISPRLEHAYGLPYRFWLSVSQSSPECFITAPAPRGHSSVRSLWKVDVQEGSGTPRSVSGLVFRHRALVTIVLDVYRASELRPIRTATRSFWRRRGD